MKKTITVMKFVNQKVIQIDSEVGQVECVCAETYLSIKLRIIC